MNEKKVNIHELIESTMEAQLGLGKSRQTVWGEYGSYYLPIGKFFRNHGNEHYDVSLLTEYCQMFQKRWENKEIVKNTMRRVEKAVANLIEFHDTGKLVWSVRARLTKYKLTEYLENVLTDFIAYNELHYGTSHTVTWAIRKYLVFLQMNGHKNLDTVETHDLQQFILFCSEMTNGSVHNILIFMKRFYHYLNDVKQISLDGSILMYCSVIREDKIQKHLAWDEITKILDKIDRSTDAGKRNYAIILLAVRTGMRAIDIANLRLKDIDWRNGTIQVMQQKTGLPVILPLIKDAGEAIKEYILKARPVCELDYVFTKLHAPYAKISGGYSIAGMFKSYQAKAGIERKPKDGKGFHALRRSMGRHMASAGVPVTTIAQVLGQSTINATKQYISFDNDNLKNCALDFCGIEVERSAM